MADFLSAHILLWAALFFAAVLVFSVLYAVRFALALQPKKGTLEWIALYDRPGLRPGQTCHRLRASALLPALTVAVLAAAAYCLAICLQLRSFSLLLQPQLLPAVLNGALMVALTALGGFFLLLSLFGSSSLAFCGALLLGLDLGADYDIAACLVFALFFLHRWMGTDFEKKARDSFLPLLCLALVLSLSVTLSTPDTPAVLVCCLTVILVALLRFRHTHRLDRFSGLFCTLGTFFLTFLGTVILWQVGLTLLQGNRAILSRPGFYLSALLYWLIPGGQPGWHILLTSAVNLPLCFFGLMGTAFSAYDLWRYGNPCGILLVCSALAGLSTALLCGTCLYTTALIPGAVYLFARSRERSHNGLVLSGLLFSFLTTFVSALRLTGVF